MFSWWFLSPGFSGFSGVLVLLLLSVLLTTLCSDCTRRSGRLQDPGTDKAPPTLISVVKLEETGDSRDSRDTGGARDNPMMSQIQQDETEFRPVEENQVSVSSRNQQEPANSGTESGSEEDVPVPVIAWRSHLVELSGGHDGGVPPTGSAHNCCDITAGRVLTPPTSRGAETED